MTTINTVPKGLTFREKASAIWSIVRNRRYRGGTRSVLYTFKPYVVEATFHLGYETVVVLYQTSDLSNYSSRAAEAAERADGRLDLLGQAADNIRVINRKNLEVSYAH